MVKSFIQTLCPICPLAQLECACLSQKIGNGEHICTHATWRHIISTTTCHMQKLIIIFSMFQELLIFPMQNNKLNEVKPCILVRSSHSRLSSPFIFLSRELHVPSPHSHWKEPDSFALDASELDASNGELCSLGMSCDGELCSLEKW